MRPPFDPTLELVDAIRSEVTTRAGFVPQQRYDERLRSALRRTLEQCHAKTESEFLECLRRNGACFEFLIGEFVIGETYFLREWDLLDHVKRVHLRTAREREGDSLIRAWCAGCSSGEEAYSLAILFYEEGLLGRARIVGSDLSRAAVARAQRATYSRWSVRAVDQQRLTAYFQDAPGGIRPLEKFREHVRFVTLNLLSDPLAMLGPTAPPFDLILCRNVFIYFTPEAIELASSRFFDALAEGGCLVLGAADPPLRPKRPDIIVDSTPHGTVYRRDHRASQTSQAVPAEFLAREAPYEDVRLNAAPVEPSPAQPSPLVARRESELELVGHVRAIVGKGGVGPALAACRAALTRFPLSVELQFLLATLELHASHFREAVAAAERVVYLDGKMAMGHFVMASALARLGDVAGATRAFRNVDVLCREQSADEPVPLGEGETFAALREAAATELARIRPDPGTNA